MSLALHPIDLAIVVGYLLGVVALGLWIGRRQKDMADYLLGDRNLPLWLVLLSIVATETSTATFLSVPGLAFKEGGNLEFLQLALGYILGRYLVVWLLLPQYFRGQLFTAYQVLHQRFGGATRQAASLLFIVTRSLADGLRLFLAAIALRAILFPNQTSTPGELDLYLSLSVVLMGVATIVYTFVGGMKAVVWTDAIQFFIYILGALLAGAIIVDRLPDGWDGLLAYGEATNRLQLFDFRFDLTKNYTFWSGLFGGAFFSLGSHGADQLMVQRYLSARSQLQAGRALWLSGWIVLAQFTLFLMLGVGLAAFYQDRTFAPDEAFVNFIVHEMPVGVVGITLAAVFAAAMSTLSSSLNSSAAAAVNDFYLPLVRPNASPEHALRITRGLTVFFGLVQISVGVAGQLLAKSVVENVLAIAAFTTGVVLGLFFLGIFTRRVGQQAALVALVVGLAALCGVKFALPLKWPGAVLAWPWYVLVGSLGTFAMGVLASYVIPDDDQPPKTAAPM